MNAKSTIPNTLRRGRASVVLIIVLAGLGGIVVGTLFAAQIQRMVQVVLKPKDQPSATQSDGQLWTCGMHPQVIQDHPGDCPICHMKLTPLKVDDAAGDPATQPVASGESIKPNRKIKYWWDPMLNPPYISDRPGKSPMGMDLIPVYEDEPNAASSAVVTIDPAVVQNMGVRVQTVTEGPLHRSIRAVGYLDEAQPNIRDINLRVSGWIKKLHADTEGMHVQQGDPLFDLYSPELRVAVEELITARRSLNEPESTADDTSRQTSHLFYDAASQKLELWGLPRTQIDALSKLDHAPETVTFASPITGHVTEKPIVEGAAIKAGDRVLRIVDHSMLWLDAQVFEKDLPFIAIGQKVEASVASQRGGAIEGEVIFIHPHVDMTTRAATVRLALPNPDLNLRPGMYATIRIEAQIAERAVLVPREAIIDTGERQLAFVALAGGRFEPRGVTMGQAGEDGMVQVIDGLVPGESIVVSGQFLLDSESRLREAVRKFLTEKQQAHTVTTTLPSAPPPSSGRVNRSKTNSSLLQTDDVVAAYLRLSESLGMSQTMDAPLDAAALVDAAHSLRVAVSGTDIEPLVESVAKSAEALRGQSLDRQRELFKALSDAVVVLVDRTPPSTHVAERLYVMHCPMAPGNWLQRSDQVSNPFYAASMKSCGEIVQTIVTRDLEGSEP